MAALEQLSHLFGLSIIEKQAGDFMEDGYCSGASRSGATVPLSSSARGKDAPVSRGDVAAARAVLVRGCTHAQAALLWLPGLQLRSGVVELWQHRGCRGFSTNF